MVQPLWKIVCPFLTKLLLGIYPNELKTYIHMKTCTQMFIADLFLTAQTWTQPKCPSIGEWMNKLWYIQTMEYYSLLKRNELSSHEKTWEKLKCILLSERSQSEKTNPVRFQLYDILEKDKIMETVKKISGCQGLERRRMNQQSSEVFQGSESLVYDTITMATYHYTFVQTHRVYNTKSET